MVSLAQEAPRGQRGPFFDELPFGHVGPREEMWPPEEKSEHVPHCCQLHNFLYAVIVSYPIIFSIFHLFHHLPKLKP